MKLGIGIGLTAVRRSGGAQIITAVITPALGPLEDGDTIASGLSADIGETGNYRSGDNDPGVGITVDVVITVNGDPALASDTASAGDAVAVVVTVTDSEANQRVFNLSRVALDIAPVATGGIADQSYTEDVAITPLDVAADFTGTRLTFALAPSSAALPAGLSLSSAGELTGTPTTVAAEVNIVVRASNSAGTADSAFGVTIAEASSLDPDAATYISAVEAADGEALEEGVRTAINDFVVGCKADAIWDALKASCILAGARTLNGCLVSLTGAAPTNVNVNFVSADYNRKTGLKGDGSTKYLDTNRNSNQQPRSNRHHSVYLSDFGTATLNRTHIGTSFEALGQDFNDILSVGDGRFVARLSRGTDTPVDAPAGNNIGFMGASRLVSTEYVKRVGGINYSDEQSSTTPRDTNYHLFNRNGGSLYSDARIQFYSIGEGIDLAALDARVTALMTALDGAIA